MTGFRELDASDPPSIGRYRILARLGAGGMGRVYLGRSPGGRAVAVKVVRPELADDPGFRARFAREVAAARRVNSFFTAGVVEADTDGTPAWLATAYVPGLSLAEALARHGPWPQSSVSALGAALGEALGAIHEAGVVHRDLKPSNVLIAADGPRVIDFGISVAAEAASALTQTGMVVGTPGFMAPEQVRGDPVGPAVDVFALGAVLVYAASGQGPFGTGSAHVVNYRAVYEPPRLDGLSPGLRALVEPCLAKNAADRPTVPVLLERLADAAGEEPVGARALVESAWLPDSLARTVLLRRQTPLPPVPEKVPPGRPAAETPPSPTTAPDPRPEPTPGDAPGPHAAHTQTSPAQPPEPPAVGPAPPPAPAPRRRLAAVLIPAGAALLAVIVLLIVVLPNGDGTGEGGSSGDGGSPGGGEALGGDETFVFGTAGDPTALDPSLASDDETFRVTRQVFETLLKHEPGGTELVGGLAESWESNEAGTAWTFHLRDGVTFHDGGELTGDVVCQNFDRWHNWSGTYQDVAVSYYWQMVFGGFAENGSEDIPEPDYAGCTAPDELTAVIEVARPSANLPGGFSLSSFGIHSPDSLEEMESQQATGEDVDITYPEYSREPGVLAGTGPFRLTDWDRDSGEVTLERFAGYWGDQAGVRELVFRTIPEEDARRQALEAGTIDGYDRVAPGDVPTLLDADFQMPTRDVFNIFYLGFTQEENEALGDLRVRRAIAHAIDRQSLVDTRLPEGSVVATQFVPDTVAGHSEDVTTYEYDTDRARDLLAQAGQENLTVEFCYPTDVTRPYMPDPEGIHERLSEDLEAAGITVEANPMVWNPTYIDTVSEGGCDLRLLGWTGDFNDGFNFLGAWFNGYSEEWGFRHPELFDLMERAGTEPDVSTRTRLCEDVNELVMEILPGLPISSSPPAIAFSPDVNPPTVSPLSHENFAEISFT
ncbi:ABC transporter substrate-binding protein [Streptomyces litchfieldiae]|uniref:ABC transporter substrate-binding protein n=1 Tax=Streptomyces litchfieldiae TaxID=3075543 RepID=A0ABU2N0P6_9ACTN|nr:ABC transporter substrate-binding protein [Streptomyces sp. DSM 44938]MDT0347471.1 ABC transporter substrate-binding protein [Streptomyces sp. DSM 44938]